jgi:trigger factor
VAELVDALDLGSSPLTGVGVRVPPFAPQDIDFFDQPSETRDTKTVSVVLSVAETGPCRKQLKIEVPAAVVDAETRRVVDEFRRQARLPGFRRGKVPSHLIKSKYQADIEQEVVERLVPRFWRQAEAEAELDPLLPPTVDEVDLRPGEGLTFLASVEVRPEIGLGDIESFDLPDPEVEPTPEEIERAVEDMRRAVAEWVAIDRPAAHGDLVNGKLVALSEQENESESHEVSFEVGDPQVWEELSLEVTGKTPGQAGEFERRQGGEDEKPPQRYRIEVESVKERDLPELDDELAARVGDFATLDELEKDIRDRLQRAKNLDRQQKRERALLDQLRDRHPVNLPSGVVDREIEEMLREYAQSLAGSGVDLESANMDWQALGEQVRPQAERRVHARLLLDAIARSKSIEVDEDEFERTLSAIARAQKTNTAAIRRDLDRSGRLAGLREQMRREKALKEMMDPEAKEPQEA